jgi:acylphosphatase
VKHARVNVRVYGRVQGVGFRAWVQRLARRERIDGYARNCADGSVRIEAAGDPAALERFLEAVRQGPPHASVRELVHEEPGADPLPGPFAIRF